jgi:outer membrane protein assembly factor BamB
VAAGTVGRRAHIWNVTAAGAAEVWSAPVPAPWTVDWAGDDIVTTHRDRRVRRHDRSTGRTVTSAIALPVAPPLPVAAAKGRGYVATTTRNDPAPGADGVQHGLVLRDASSLDVVREFAVDGQPLAFSDDGTRLLASDRKDFTSKVHILDPTDGTPMTSLEAPEEGLLELSGTFLPDGRHVAVDQMATTWLLNTDTGEVAATVCADELGTNVAASSDGELLIVDGRSGIEVFDLEQVFDLGTSIPMTCEDGGANPSDAARVRLLAGANSRFMELSPDGTVLSSVSENGDVALWDPRTGDLLFTIPHDGEVGGGAFSDDGRHLAVTVNDPDGAADAVRIYTLDVDELLEIADAKVTRELTPEECAGYRIAGPCGSATAR